MCGYCGCDDPAVEHWTPAMRVALILIRELYATRDGIIGGPMHATLDDMNLADSQTWNWDPIDYRQTPGYEWEDEKTLRETCDVIQMLLFDAMTEAERYTVVGSFHEERRKNR